MKKLLLVFLMLAAIALISCGREAETTADREAADVAAAGPESTTCTCEGGVCTLSTETCVCECPCGCKFEGEWECEGGVCTKVLACGCKCEATWSVDKDGKSTCECSYECSEACADGCECKSS